MIPFKQDQLPTKRNPKLQKQDKYRLAKGSSNFSHVPKSVSVRQYDDVQATGYANDDHKINFRFSKYNITSFLI